jgi:hypothetical protein
MMIVNNDDDHAMFWGIMDTDWNIAHTPRMSSSLVLQVCLQTKPQACMILYYYLALSVFHNEYHIYAATDTMLIKL